MSWHIDFETYSEVDLRTVGAFRYAEDPTTEALILAFTDGTFPPIAVDLTQEGAEEKLHPLFEAIEQGEKLCAHNAQFERVIWEKACNFPITPRPDQWDCTAVRARLLGFPGSLEGAAEALSLQVNKDPEGQKLIQLFSKPNRGKRIHPKDEPERFKAFMAYCQQDVAVELELDKLLLPMPEAEKEAFNLDYLINDKGMPVSTKEVKQALSFVEKYSKTLEEKAIAIAGVKPSQRAKLLEFLEARGLNLPDLTAQTVRTALEQSNLDKPIREVLEARIELSRAGTKKLVTMLACASPDNRVRGSFMFSAATTRRWSSKGVQLQNLQKPEGETNPELLFDALEHDVESLPLLFKTPLTAIAQSIRGFFKADSVFTVADFSSIEVRVAAWLAGEEWVLEAYRQGRDVYKEMASKIYGKPVEQITKEERFVGKQAVLGCGYGMGAQRFTESVARFGRTMSLEEAQEVVALYRESMPNLVKFWRDIERAMITATRTWEPKTLGKIDFEPYTFNTGVKILLVHLPGGTMGYPSPTVRAREWNGITSPSFVFKRPLGRGFVWNDSFGGFLTENVTQAVARDLLRDALLRLHSKRFNVVAHVHDEIILEGDYDVKEIENLLAENPPWAEGLPLAAEGYKSKRYEK